MNRPVTPRTPTGKTLAATALTPDQIALAAVQTCIRHAVARLQEGVLEGCFSPEPVSAWRVTWHAVDEATIDVDLQVAEPVDMPLRSAVSETIRRLGFEPIVQYVLGGGVSWIIPMEVSPL